MKDVKIYIVTYKRPKILNDTLERLFESDFKHVPVDRREVNIINNHSSFYLKPRFTGHVNVLHNVLRPDWSNGNLAENWNQALINGFRKLDKPDAHYVVTFQNDTSVHRNWFSHLMEMHKKYNFVVGKMGDNIVSYTPEAVKSIGIWDENFFGVQYKEADYWIRALMWNKDKSCINDVSHGLTLNNEHALELDTIDGRNIDSKTLQRFADDEEHKRIWAEGRGGIFKEYVWKYFQLKWSNTWHKEPTKKGWIKHWPNEFKKTPPDLARSRVKTIIKYFYFEKDIVDLNGKNYLV